MPGSLPIPTDGRCTRWTMHIQNSAQIYQGLRVLAGRGVVLSERPEPGISRDRRPYRITPTGSSGQTGLSRPSRPEHKLDRAVVLDEMTRSGFRLVGEPDLLPYQYVLIFAAS